MNIFFTNTPYHVLLSYSIAQEYDRNLLLASGEEPGRELIEAIAEHPKSPFDRAEVADQKRCDQRLLRAIERRRTIQNLRSFVESIDGQVDHAHIFHKGSTEALALLHFLQTEGPGYDTGVYVEDGIEAYSDHKFDEKSLPVVAIGKLLYGWWWRDATPLYSSEYIQRARATFPDSLRSELHHLPSQAISSTPLTGPAMQDIIRQYFNTLGVHIPNDITHLVVAPHSDLLTDQPELAQRIEAAVSDLDEDTKLAVKYHPRDKSASFLDFNDFIIPTQIPVETIYVANDNLNYVIGGRSTALMTAKWLTDAEVLSIYQDLPGSDHTINSTLADIGVRDIQAKNNPP